MTVKELYDKLNERIPSTLSEPWDNDGVMCCTDTTAEIKNVLVTLDVTEEIVDYAIERSFDLIISHHPLIFKPISSLTAEEHISRKLIKLVANNISVFSFHTRADKVEGGVNDILARALSLKNVRPFGEDGLGRIGELDSECELDVFCETVKSRLHSEGMRVADGYDTVHKVAVVGGDGKDFLAAAIAEGADTFVSGRLSYNVMEDAPEIGMNLIEAGHYYTEQPVTEFFAGLVSSFDGNAYVEIADSNMIKII